MTIDHDALARRITERLSYNRFLRLPKLSGLETLGLVEKCIASVLREAMPTSEATCEWTQQEYYASHRWMASCGNEMRLEKGWPNELGMKFCCFCGRNMIEVPVDRFESEDDE